MNREPLEDRRIPMTCEEIEMWKQEYYRRISALCARSGSLQDFIREVHAIGEEMLGWTPDGCTSATDGN